MQEKIYSIVEIDTGEKFGRFNLEQEAKAKACYYASTFRERVAVIDNYDNVVCGYDRKGGLITCKNSQ